jgi:hypothetical protein
MPRLSCWYGAASTVSFSLRDDCRTVIGSSRSAGTSSCSDALSSSLSIAILSPSLTLFRRSLALAAALRTASARNGNLGIDEEPAPDLELPDGARGSTRNNSSEP